MRRSIALSILGGNAFKVPHYKSNLAASNVVVADDFVLFFDSISGDLSRIQNTVLLY